VLTAVEGWASRQVVEVVYTDVVVVGSSLVVVVGPEVVVVGSSVVVVVDSVVVVGSSVVVVGSSVVVVVGAVVVVVGGGTSQPVTQNTLCFTSAPCEPSLLTVSFTCQPCWGCCSNPCNAVVRS
jgi:hypothetical protein